MRSLTMGLSCPRQEQLWAVVNKLTYIEVAYNEMNSLLAEEM